MEFKVKKRFTVSLPTGFKTYIPGDIVDFEEIGIDYEEKRLVERGYVEAEDKRLKVDDMEVKGHETVEHKPKVVKRKPGRKPK